MVNWILLKEGQLKHIFTIISSILPRDTCVSRSPSESMGSHLICSGNLLDISFILLLCHREFFKCRTLYNIPLLKTQQWSFFDLQMRSKIISMGHEFLHNGFLPIPLQSSPGPGHHPIVSLSQTTCSLHLHNFVCTVPPVLC